MCCWSDYWWVEFRPIWIYRSQTSTEPTSYAVLLGPASEGKYSIKMTVSLFVFEWFTFSVSLYLSVAEADYDCHRESLEKWQDGTKLITTATRKGSLRGDIRYAIIDLIQFTESCSWFFTVGLELCFRTYAWVILLIITWKWQKMWKKKS